MLYGTQTPVQKFTFAPLDKNPWKGGLSRQISKSSPTIIHINIGKTADGVVLTTTSTTIRTSVNGTNGNWENGTFSDSRDTKQGGPTSRRKLTYLHETLPLVLPHVKYKVVTYLTCLLTRRDD